MPDLAQQFPRTCHFLADKPPTAMAADQFLLWLQERQQTDTTMPGWLPELAQLEQLVGQVARQWPELPEAVQALSVNPSLQLLSLSWQQLVTLLHSDESAEVCQGEQLVLVWRHAITAKLCYRPASEQDLLALKLVSEKLDLQATAQELGIGVGQLDLALEHGEDHGLLMVPPSRLRRDPHTFHATELIDSDKLTTPAFTLQWHITQACDLHCKHCYDRSSRQAVSLEQGIAVLDQFRAFCRERFVYGQVTFTGGNPLLHPDFFALYEAAAQRGLRTAILGNPTDQETLTRIQAIQPLAFYQVSLEGLEQQNDEIRGPGHFQRILDFLPLLKALKIRALVMLTLTRANQADVLPLAELLRDKVDYFTFNRLAMVGEGADLVSAERDGFVDFLRDFRQAAQENPCMGLKDNLFNLQAWQDDQPLQGGCTGFGCGAAFNFVSLLPDGELHACRKFPSPLGNLYEQGLATLYDSPLAQQYRQGPEQCQGCKIRPLCGGCLAVSHGLGLDVFTQRDPYCFLH